MSVILWFNDGTNAVLPDGVGLRPLAGNDNWLEVTNNQGTQYALASVKDLHYAQIGG